MKAKRALLLLIASALIVIVSTLTSKGIDPIALVGGSVLVLFMVCVFVDGPKKHREYTYSDQLAGMLQSYGGNPPPEVQPPEELRGRDA